MLYAQEATIASTPSSTPKDKKEEEEDSRGVGTSLVRRSRSGSVRGATAFAAAGKSQMQGLRSRRASAHRRNNIKDEVHVIDPLHASSSQSANAASAGPADDTVTRPRLHRWLSASEDGEVRNENSVSVEDESNADEDGYGNSEGEVPVIEHFVSDMQCTS